MYKIHAVVSEEINVGCVKFKVDGHHIEDHSGILWEIWTTLHDGMRIDASGESKTEAIHQLIFRIGLRYNDQNNKRFWEQWAKQQAALMVITANPGIDAEILSKHLNVPLLEAVKFTESLLKNGKITFDE